MEWIWAHKIEIFAIIGAAYTTALGIVALTPTSDDDEWLEKNVGKPLKMLARIFGLNIKIGRKVKETKDV